MMKRVASALAVGIAVLSLTTPALAKPTLAQKCAATKLNALGKYHACLFAADAKGLLKGVPSDHSKCVDKLIGAWQKVEQKIGASCPSLNDRVAVASAADAQISTAAAGIIGNGTSCGNGLVSAGEECDGLNLGGATCASLGFDVGDLGCSATCTFATAGCFLTCDLLTQDCAAGTSCYLSDVAICAATGTLAEGAPCTQVTNNECVEGALCAGTPASKHCLRICNTNSGQPPMCSAGTCVAIGVPNVGVCP